MIVATYNLQTDKTRIHPRAAGLGRRRWKISLFAANDDGKVSWGDFFLRFGLPTLAGNIIGGSFIFALISHAQIRNDMDVQRQGRRGAWGFARKRGAGRRVQ